MTPKEWKDYKERQRADTANHKHGKYLWLGKSLRDMQMGRPGETAYATGDPSQPYSDHKTMPSKKVRQAIKRQKRKERVEQLRSAI